MSGIEIEVAENGYEVCFDDPEVVKKNRDPKAKSWEDPEKCYVFKTPAEVTDFLTKLLPKLTPSEDDASKFTSEFNAMANKESD